MNILRIMRHPAWLKRSKMDILIGYNSQGQIVTRDLTKMPHLLVAGTTGSGKSVLMHSIICSLIYNNNADDLQLALIDPKRVELSLYKKLGHVYKVAINPQESIDLLDDLINDMEYRYTKMEKHDIRDIKEYINQSGDRLPTIVLVIDELAHLVLSDKNIEKKIVVLASMGRAAGIHIIAATQRPDAKVLSGLLRANLPSRIALRVNKAAESRIILDDKGAEELKGRGDMLLSMGGNKPVRLQGFYIKDSDLERYIDMMSVRHPRKKSSWNGIKDHLARMFA